MPATLQRILADVPDLASRQGWTILAAELDTVLVAVPGTGFGLGNPSITYEPSEVAVVEHVDGRYALRHRETYEAATRSGALHVATRHAVLSRHYEYDDFDSIRYGYDDVYVIDYTSTTTRRLASYPFQEGSYLAGQLLFSINAQRNWILILRNEKDEFGDTERPIAYIFDLIDSEQIAKAPLLTVETVRTVQLAGAGTVVVVTDQGLQDHVFCLNAALKTLDHVTYQATQYKWKIAISFQSEDRSLAREIASLLKKEQIASFFDEDLGARGLSWGRSLQTHLPEVYGAQSEYVLVLVSRHYLSGRWPREEYDAIRARAAESGAGFILPVSVDGTILPELGPETVFVDLQNTSMGELVDLVKRRIGA